MPHIIVEYSKNLDVIMPELLIALRDALGELDGIEPDRLKLRAIGYTHCIVGNKGAGADMLHICLQLLSGRDVPTRTLYGQALHKVLKAYAPQGCSVTLEVRDMDRETYCL